jgi:hypothetical protein
MKTKTYEELFKPTNEALKMLIRPLMVNIMKQFGFKSDPGIRAELEAEIRDAVQSVLSKHGVIVEAEDHEVGMAQGQLTAIIKDATELQGKVGTMEKDIPGWIQGHITSAYEYLKQANDNFHELHEAVKIGVGSKYVIAPVMSGTKIGFTFIGDSATIEKKSKQQQADEVLSSIRKFNKDLANVLEYTPNHDAAGVVFLLNTYTMVTFLENNMK